MRYMAQQLRFLEYGYKLLRVPELTRAFNSRFGMQKTAAQIKSTLSNHRIICDRPNGSITGTLRIVTPEQATFVRENYKRMSLTEVTDALNREFDIHLTLNQVRGLTRNHVMRSGRTGRFEPGQKPWSAGTRGILKRNKGSFRKGDMPANIKPLGSERISKDGYIEIKVNEPNPHTGAPTRYRFKHQVVWKGEYGPIPAGHIVAFRDGNKLNCDPDNLLLLTKAQNLYLNRNGYGDLPAALRPSMLAAAKLFTRAKELERRQGT